MTQKLTAYEAKILARGRLGRFYPKGAEQQLAVCALMSRGLMTVNGPLHGDNRCWTTERGGFALAEFSFNAVT